MAGLLVSRGAVLIDADVIAREVVDPSTLAFDAVVDAFGPGVVASDGTLDRAAIAAIVFNDPIQRGRLNAIVHPLVYARIAERLSELGGSDDVVILDVPLLLESGNSTGNLVAEVIVVAASRSVALARLVARGMDEADALARMDAQMPIEDKVAAADWVVRNDGSLDDLTKQVDELWSHLVTKVGPR